MEVLEQEKFLMVLQVSIQIQQHQTRQAHWERTVRITLETVVVAVPVVVVKTAVYQVMVDQETLEEQAVGLDQI